MKVHDEKKEVVREVGVEGCSCCSWHAARSGDREMRIVVRCSCIHRQSTGHFHDEIAMILVVGSSMDDPRRQSEAAVAAGAAVADNNGRPMRFEQVGVEALDSEERNPVFEVWAVVHFAHQPVVVDKFEEEAGVEVQAPAGSSVATDLVLAHHSRCHHTCWAMTALAVL
jgi:hypothetical protein